MILSKHIGLVAFGGALSAASACGSPDGRTAPPVMSGAAPDATNGSGSSGSGFESAVADAGSHATTSGTSSRAVASSASTSTANDGSDPDAGSGPIDDASSAPDAPGSDPSHARDASDPIDATALADGGAPGAPGVRIVGRTAPGTNAGSVRFSWPGANIHARFTGTQVSMSLNDGSNRNRFTVVVDGNAPFTVTTSPGQTSLPLATGLPAGSHELVVWRNTEASIGVTTFSALSSFGAGGGLLPAGPAPNRRIEVVGDSLSVGAGVEGNSACPGGIDAFTNNYLAYGSVAARTVGADVVTIAWSGIGVYRNYDGSMTGVMPDRYPYAVPNDGTPWNFALYQPDVVVINLGTNDFGRGDPGTPYETAYEAFVRTIRSKYPSAYFILIDMYGGERLTRINDVVAALKSSGESKVESLSLSSVQNNLGCNQHPNVAGQAAMGAVLASRLRFLMGW